MAERAPHRLVVDIAARHPLRIAPNGASNELPGGRCKRVVQPDDDVGASPNEIAHHRVAAVDDPCGLPGCNINQLAKLGIRAFLPPWQPVQIVELGMRDLQFHRQIGGQR